MWQACRSVVTTNLKFGEAASIAGLQQAGNGCHITLRRRYEDEITLVTQAAGREIKLLPLISNDVLMQIIAN